MMPEPETGHDSADHQYPDEESNSFHIRVPGRLCVTGRAQTISNAIVSLRQQI
jgi:hypothetical protein